MLFALIAVLIASAINAWINIQIKFAQSKAEALAFYKKLLYGAFLTLVFGSQIIFLIAFCFSKEPLTRQSVGFAIFMIGSFLFNLILLLVVKVVDSVHNRLDSLNEHVCNHAENIAHLAKSVGCDRIQIRAANKEISPSRMLPLSKQEPAQSSQQSLL